MSEETNVRVFVGSGKPAAPAMLGILRQAMLVLESEIASGDPDIRAVTDAAELVVAVLERLEREGLLVGEDVSLHNLLGQQTKV